MSCVSGQKFMNNTTTELLVEKLSNNHRIIGHKDISVLQPCELMQKLKAVIIVDDPVCSYTLNLNCIGFVVRIFIALLFFLKEFFKEVLVDVRIR
jgi:hypothetical protein